MFKKLLFAAVLTSAAFAQKITIVEPAAGAKLAAGSPLTIQLEESASSGSIEEIAIAIGVSTCLSGCPTDNGLGAVIYTGNFKPTGINKAGKAYQNISVKTPNWFNGEGVLSVAHVYLSGVRNLVEVGHAKTTITVTGSSG